MPKKNEGLTPEQIVAARIKEGDEARAHNKLHVLKMVDRLIGFLQANREAIGGLSVNVLADTDTALYDPEDNDATDGLAFQVSTRNSIIDSMNKHLKDIIDYPHEDFDVDDGASFLREMLSHASPNQFHLIDGGAIHLTEGEKKGGR